VSGHCRTDKKQPDNTRHVQHQHHTVMQCVRCAWLPGCSSSSSDKRYTTVTQLLDPCPGHTCTCCSSMSSGSSNTMLS
jgi:hypothetical protein